MHRAASLGLQIDTTISVGESPQAPGPRGVGAGYVRALGDAARNASQCIGGRARAADPRSD